MKKKMREEYKPITTTTNLKPKTAFMNKNPLVPSSLNISSV